MKRALLSIILLVLPASAVARPRHWYTDKKWYLGEFFVAASIGADAASTVQRTNRQIEGNRFLGRNPSRQKVIGVALLSMSLQTSYHALAWHLTVGEDDTRPWRIVSYTAVPIICMSIYGTAAVHNYHLEFPHLKVQPSMVKGQ